MTRAEIMLQQLGGRRFIAMTGACNFLGSPYALSMRFPNPHGGPNALRMELNGSDLYDLTFSRIRGGKVTVVEQVEDIYAESLPDVFTRVTGLATSLGRVRRPD